MNLIHYLNRKNLYLPSLIIASLALSSSCSKEERWEEQATTEATQEFKITEVKSYETGHKLELSLNLDLDKDGLRSLSYLEQAETGELIGIKASENEELHLFIRKEGDNRSTAVGTVQWTHRSNDKISIPKLNIALPPGFDVRAGETWYIAGILGGRLNKTNKEVNFGTNSLQEAIEIATNNTVDIPYSFSWKRLEITSENKAKLGETKLSPIGTLIRLDFYNNLLDSFEAKQIELKSNAFQAHGTFSPLAVDNNNLQAGKKFLWQALNPEDTTAETWQYSLGDNNRKLSLPSGSGRNAEHNVMLWVMPNNKIRDKETETSIKLTVKRKNTAEPEVFETYQKVGHRLMQSGQSYRLSNKLTADPYISEVYYQYAPETRQDGNRIERHNYSIVEIYNPTIEDIDLSRYALVRTTQKSNKATPSAHLYFAAGATEPTETLTGAAFLPLGVLSGESRTAITPFPLNGKVAYDAPWHKVVYGEATQTLKAGKTLLIGAAGYVHTDHKPSANIERFNEQLPNYRPGSVTMSIERHYLPRAGMQIDSAYKAGYAQAMIAIDNSGTETKDRDPNPDGVGSVIQLGYGQGLALIKMSINHEGRHEYEVVDASAPINNINETRNYLNILRINLARLGATPIPTNIYSSTNYSQVRKAGVKQGNKTFDLNEWEWAISENDGVKSLGSRTYIAGLTPFETNYTGYDSNNNPKGNPFWRNAQSAPQLPTPKNNPDHTTGGLIQTNKQDMPELYAKVNISSSWASSRLDGHDISLSHDNNTETYYHSQNKKGARFPMTVVYNLTQAEKLSYLKYTPRDQAGSIRSYSVTLMYQDGSSEVVSSGDLGAPTQPVSINLSGRENKTTAQVRLTVNSTGNGVLSIKEIAFFKETNFKSIFADQACTELRPGITYKEIMAIQDPFYREMARKMYQGTYPREFRIADYKAWPQSTIMQGENRTWFNYSVLDNPTGISVKAGQELVVLVGPTKGNSLSLRVMDLSIGTAYNNDGFSRAGVYPLQEGENRIRLKHSGLVHVLYNVPQKEIDRNRYPNIKVHFVDGFGEVNGYYDARNPNHQGRWEEFIRKAKHPYYEVLGEFSHIAFPTDYFRKNTTNADRLISLYDKLVKSEMELLGLYRYKRLFTNRMFFHVIYYGNMFAYSGRTFYTIGAMNEMTNPDRFMRGGWGQGHEVGHINQTWGLRWEGLEEVTCNIMAAYIQTTVFGNNCRLQVEGGKNNNRYRQAWTTAFLTEKPTHAAIMNVFSKVVPFWQLELYFGKAMDRTPSKQSDKGGFYPDLYERLRTVNHPQNPHHQQAEFAYHISKVSGYDMTDFCERWGFLRAANGVTARKSHADTFNFSLPQDVVDDVKKRIKQLPNLRKPSPVMHLISDVNYSYFRSPIREVVRGTVSRLGNVVSLNNWKNVVCYVVTNAQGQDIYYNEGKSAPEDTVAELTSDGFSWDETGIRLYSIDANGKRTPISLP